MDAVVEGFRSLFCEGVSNFIAGNASMGLFPMESGRPEVTGNSKSTQVVVGWGI
jgi:hypothetical protein